MKKLFLFFSMLSCCLAGFSQSLSPSVSVTESGVAFVVTGVGESNSAYFSSVSVVPTGITSSSPDAFGGNWVTLGQAYQINTYNSVMNTPTSFRMTVTNGHPSYDYTITFNVSCVVSSFGAPNPPVNKTVTIKVKHAPEVFYNDAKSQAFYKSNCDPGYESEPIIYSVPANKYQSDISKEDANSKAQAEINANGQNKANAEGICKFVYYNTEASATFTKNNCGPNLTPTSVNYVVPANTHKSLISQGDADAKAQADINANGQNYANANGTCIALPYLEGPDQAYTTVDYTYFVGNRSPDETYEWIIPTNFTVVGGLNDFAITLVPKRAGTAPNPRTIKVKITKSNGEVVTLSKVVTIIYCLNCPV